MFTSRILKIISASLIFIVPVAAYARKPEKEQNSLPLETVVRRQQQQLVESVDIQGNRRLRDEDLLYYIKTRPGDVFDQAQVERDLRELLSLNFFDKVATKVLTEPGARGGVNITFEVSELPVVRDLQFKGLSAVPESEILKAFREQRVGISKESVFNPVGAQKGVRVIRELLAAKGFPNATVNFDEEAVSATSTAVTYTVEQGRQSRIVEIEFEGNEVFSSGELRNQLLLVKQTGLISRFKGADILDLRKLEYDLQKNVREYMFSKGYFQARIGEPQVVGLGVKRTDFIPLVTLPLPLVSSKDDTLKIVIPVTEGKVYRVGEIKVEGNSIFSEQQILAGIGLTKGEIVDGKRIRNALYEDLKKAYGSQGFVQYDAELDPEFKDNPANPKEGIVDITLTIDEGRQFRLRRLEFAGNTFTRDKVLRREFLLSEGDVYNQQSLEYSVLRLNQTGYFDPLDKDRDVEIRTDEEQADVDAIVKVKEKGRQQISFNGGVGGTNGTSFGLEYSTNNLLGRGETLSLQGSFGNRSNSFQFSFQNPYFRDRPINVGFSLFASTYKFYGEGTSYTQNTTAYEDYVNTSSGYTSTATDVNNLFTQNTYGASVFATAQLSELYLKKRKFTQFSRVGLTYQFSATSIKEPAVNADNDPTTRIPNLYAQPSYTTSRVTSSFVYDTRQPSGNGIDTARGSQLSLSFGLAGLGGDVRTYQPSLSFSQYVPVRNRKSSNPHVFAYRIAAGTVGSFAAKNNIKNSNSLSFINGVPYSERYFLGGENDVRGYESRSIGPVSRLDGYVTSRNVSAATNSSGTAEAVSGLNQSELDEIAALGIFTGADGSNPGQISSSYQSVGGDSQLLGNFEYRVPVFGPVSLAAFADIGTVFNLRNSGTQSINSTFLADDTFVGAGTLTALALRNNPGISNNSAALLLFNNRLLTNSEYYRLFCNGNSSGCPTSPPVNVQQIYLRGETQVNSVLRLNESVFNKFGDFRASIGAELRVQVPIVNVPFRLIYYYNPNGNFGYTKELPNVYLSGKRSGFRFSVGRTF